MLKLNKINMTEQKIAKIFSENNISERSTAIDCLIDKYLSDISNKKSEMIILNDEKKFYSNIAQSPKSYAATILNLVGNLIFENSIKNNSTVEYDINLEGSYVEFKFDIFNGKSVECDKEYAILISKNGVVVDLDGDYASVSRNRTNPKFWNARFPENLVDYLPMVDNKKRGKTKLKVRI